MSELEIRNEIRTQIRLGHYDVDDVIAAVERAHTKKWVREQSLLLCNPYKALRREIAAMLHNERKRADRETASQRRMRLQREREEAISLSLVSADASDDDVDAIDAFTWFSARLERDMNAFKRETIVDFFTDLLVPQSVPGHGWKRRADLTRDDCLAVADDYSKKASSESGMALAFASFADAISEQGVQTLGEISVGVLVEAA